MVSNNSPWAKPAHQDLVKGALCLLVLLASPATMISAGSWCVGGGCGSHISRIPHYWTGHVSEVPQHHSSPLWSCFQLLPGGCILCQEGTRSLCCLSQHTACQGKPSAAVWSLFRYQPEAGEGMLSPCCAPGHSTSSTCPTGTMEHTVKPNSWEPVMEPAVLAQGFVCVTWSAHALCDTLPYRTWLRSSRTGSLSRTVPLSSGFPCAAKVPALPLSWHRGLARVGTAQRWTATTRWQLSVHGESWEVNCRFAMWSWPRPRGKPTAEPGTDSVCLEHRVPLLSVGTAMTGTVQSWDEQEGQPWAWPSLAPAGPQQQQGLHHPEGPETKLTGSRSDAKGNTSQVLRGKQARPAALEAEGREQRRHLSREPPVGHTRPRASVPVPAAALRPWRVRVAAPQGAQAAAPHQGQRRCQNNHKLLLKSCRNLFSTRKQIMKKDREV